MGNEKPQNNGELIITENKDVVGLQPHTLEELRSIAFHYGSYYPDEPNILGFATQALGTETSLILTVPIEPKLTYMIVGKSETPAVFPIQTTRGLVLWDQSLTSEEAEQAISEMNDKAAQVGIYNPDTKERSMVRSMMTEAKYSVDNIFSNPGTSFFVGNQDPVRVLNQFDKPEHLMLQELPGGGIAIVLRKDVFYLKRRQKIVEEILAEKGISLADPNTIANLSFEEILAIRKEAQERLQASES